MGIQTLTMAFTFLSFSCHLSFHVTLLGVFLISVPAKMTEGAQF